MNTSNKLLRIGTQQYSSYIYCRLQTIFSPQIIMLKCMPQTKIYTKRKIASKKQNLEHKCVLHESCKTVRSSACQGRSLRRRLRDWVIGFTFVSFLLFILLRVLCIITRWRPRDIYLQNEISFYQCRCSRRCLIN